ncbi:hypothetical protein ACH5RR_029900 [Cinchona calisaya]|uniref:RRM domain-containing protein n=1 Tax=Cinchona calisaya TaxID=153742 RepID=A0ABD2YUH7_9GENT
MSKTTSLDEETAKKSFVRWRFTSVIVIFQGILFLNKPSMMERMAWVTELAKLEEVIEQLDVKTIAAPPLETLFCGTALVEFSSKEDAAKVLEQNLVYAGMDLELKLKKVFDAERAKPEEE